MCSISGLFPLEVPLMKIVELANSIYPEESSHNVGWLVVLGLTALGDSISVYIGPSPREREKEKRNDRGE